jgi:hypothetical protein
MPRLRTYAHRYEFCLSLHYRFAPTNHDPGFIVDEGNPAVIDIDAWPTWIFRVAFPGCRKYGNPAGPAGQVARQNEKNVALAEFLGADAKKNFTF